MKPEGFWSKPGAGYNPKYRSAVWSLLMLAQLGASISDDARIATACEYYLDQALASGGQFGYNGAPSGTIDCLQGNMCWALTTLGCTDPRLESAYEWMARSVTGDGVAPASDKSATVRYYAYQCGPLFACGANNKLPCAWGAVKVMMAFAQWPDERRTALINKAIQQGVEFLFSCDPAEALYPSGVRPSSIHPEGGTQKPSRDWWKFGFPVFYVTDILQIAEALVRLGYGSDPRLANTIRLIREKQDGDGRWALEYDYSGKTWVNFGSKKEPNKWVTLRALRVLKAAADRYKPR